MTPKKPAYQPPRFEPQGQYVMLTGVSLPINTNTFDNPLEWETNVEVGETP